MLQKWLTDKLINITDKNTFPRTQKWLWKVWYQAMARFWRDSDWAFMNYGYLSDRIEALALAPEDDKDRCFIGLYEKVTEGIGLDGLKVLEVGSGRGGGCAYLARYRNPEKVTGLDFSDRAISLSRQFHREIGNLEFIQGDAENMPFESESFDVVINVESSHCYSNMQAFVDEVARVLKPGGWFLWADIRSKGMLQNTEQAFQNSVLMLGHEEEINEGVVAALSDIHERKSQLINRFKPLKPLLQEFSATKGAAIFKGLKSGSVYYLCRHYRKPG